MPTNVSTNAPTNMSASDFESSLKALLSQRKQQQRYRQRLTLSSPQSTHLQIDGERLLSFSGNDYLGLANHPAVIDTLQSAASERGVGSGASHLVSGHSDYHHQLEQALAEFTGRERVLLCSTGYMANLGVISAFAGRGDQVFEDKLNHASLLDAALLSRAELKRFRHNDHTALAAMLEQAQQKNGRSFVAVDGVFSMDGDLAPLDHIAELCQQYQAPLMVDDAHGFGVLGQQGGGCAEYFALSQQQLPLLVGTLGKAFGTFGAFIAGSETVIESLIQFARPYIYTTALPPAIAAATLTSLQLLQSEHWRRQNLQARIQQFRRGAEALGLSLLPSQTPIQPLVLGDDNILLKVAQGLRLEGLLVGAIRPPTVPEGSARLRITFSAEHREEDVEHLLKALDKVMPLNVRRG